MHTTSTETLLDWKCRKALHCESKRLEVTRSTHHVTVEAMSCLRDLMIHTKKSRELLLQFYTAAIIVHHSIPIMYLCLLLALTRSKTIITPANYQTLVNLHVPLLVLLELRQLLLPALPSLLRHLLEGVLNPRHHSLQTTEVDVSTTIQKLENLIAVLLDLVLDVHLATALVLLLPAEGFVVPKARLSYII